VVGINSKWRLIKQADIVLFGGGGFGFTIVFPDAARRHYGPDRCCMIFLGPKGRYNSVFETMFSDIDMIIIMLSKGISILGRDIQVNYRMFIHITFVILRWWLRVIMNKEVIDWRTGMHRELPYPEMANMPGGRGRLAAEMHRKAAFQRYYRLREDVAAPPIRLNDIQRHIIENAILRADERMNKKITKICCLYTRLKGDATSTWDAFVRSGSSLEDFEPSINFLIKRGYRVLVIGDRKLSDKMAERYADLLLDAGRLGVDENLFAAYAATEADFFLGEAGGGVCVPLGADLPCLLVNWLQYYSVVPHATHYYKHLRGEDGTILPPDQLFGRFGWDLEYKGYEVLNNSPNEILSAVTDFVDCLESEKPLGLKPSVLGETWPDMFFHFTKEAYISPVWLKLFEKNLEGKYNIPANISTISEKG